MIALLYFLLAQGGPIPVYISTTVPSSPCNPRMSPTINPTTGAFYVCKAGTVVNISGSGAGFGVSSVALSTNLGTVTGSPVTTSGTLTNTVSAAQIVARFSGCSGVLYLGADGACHSSTGTVSSISTSNGITGGPITTTGTISGINAVADGSTIGVSTFTAADFNSSAGVISLDYTNGQKANGSQPGYLSSTDWTTFNGKGSGSVTSIATSAPLGGGTITTTGTLTCSTCATTTNGGLLSATSPVSISAGGVIACSTCSTTTGTVTSIATTSPITGGTITGTGTIACATCAVTGTTISTTSPIGGGGDLSANRTFTCATCVVASSPGVGIAHFAGSTQTVTSSAVNLAGADVSGVAPVANGGAVAQGSNLCGTSDLCASGNFTSAQIVSLTGTASTRILVIAAPASGSMIVVDYVTYEVAYNGVAYGAGAAANLYYNNSGNSTSSATGLGLNTFSQANKNMTAGVGFSTADNNPNLYNGLAIYFGLNTGATSFTCASTCGSVYYWIKYRIITGLQ